MALVLETERVLVLLQTRVCRLYQVVAGSRQDSALAAP